VFYSKNFSHRRYPYVYNGCVNRIDFAQTAELIILSGDLTIDHSCREAKHVLKSFLASSHQQAANYLQLAGPIEKI